MRRRHRTVRAATTLGIVAVGLVAAGWWLRPWQAAGDAGTPPDGDTVTTAVERTSLTDQVLLSGDLTYGDAVPLPAAAGTITALPAAGAVVEPGQQVYEVDGRPVVLFQAERPFWRTLEVGAEPGADVRQLEQALATLGFFPDEPDGRFDWVTRQAVRDWQHSLGVPQTGTFAPGDVVVSATPGIRVAQVTARLGDQSASPATYTEATLRVVAKLTTAQARELSAGTPVTVVLPDGTELDATLSAVDPGGQPTGDGTGTTTPTATILFPDQSRVTATGPAGVRVVVRDDADAAATLVVPATALLAGPDGGYAVEVQTADGIVRSTVEVGLVADARVQVLRSGTEVTGGSGPVLQAGDLVVLSR